MYKRGSATSVTRLNELDGLDVQKYLTVAAALFLIVLVAGCQMGAIGVSNDDKDSNPTETASPRAVIKTTATSNDGLVPVGSVSTTVPEVSPTPQATPTPLPDRTDCAEIFGTDYHSPAEREWYLGNCLPTPEPTPEGGDVEPVTGPGPPAIPGPQVPGERWILVDIATQTTTAMIGNAPLYTAYVTTGMDGWETPPGTYQIIYRVENETMTSESIGAEEYYVLEDVLYTQYFTNEGHALHLNYWRGDEYFGNIRSSHGCVGMRLADAEFFWNFAEYGTRVTIQ